MPDNFLRFAWQATRPYERHGIKYIVTAPGYRMKYHDRKDYRNDLGRVLEFVTRDEETDVFVTVKIQFYDGISVARFVTEVENRGAEEQTLEYVSLFNYTGIEKEGLLPRDEKMLVKVPHSSWQREMDWQTYTLPQLGLGQSQKTSEQRSSKAANFTNTGNWSTKEYLPMGIYREHRDRHLTLFSDRAQRLMALGDIRPVCTYVPCSQRPQRAAVPLVQDT